MCYICVIYMCLKYVTQASEWPQDHSLATLVESHLLVEYSRREGPKSKRRCARESNDSLGATWRKPISVSVWAKQNNYTNIIGVITPRWTWAYWPSYVQESPWCICGRVYCLPCSKMALFWCRYSALSSRMVGCVLFGSVLFSFSFSMCLFLEGYETCD